MPTFRGLPAFWRDHGRLSKGQQVAFREAVRRFVADLGNGRFTKGLRVKGVRGAPGVFEMTWALDGRATFEFGKPVREGDAHVVWRRVGTHEILRSP